MMRRVLKWNVPIDDDWHPIGAGPVVYTTIQFEDSPGNPAREIQVWTEEQCDERGNLLSPANGRVRVVGTGHRVPDLTEHIGSAVGAGGHLVWHVYRAQR